MSDDSSFLAFRYPLLYLDLVVPAGAAALFCLLAIWVGVGRHHWFPRAAVLILTLLALLPVQAHQPALMFALVLPAIAGSAAWLNRRGIGPFITAEAAAPRKLRFGVRDLLMAMLLIGLVCFGATVLIERAKEVDWQRLLVAAPSIWLLAMLCYLFVFTRRKRFHIALSIVLAVPAVALVELWAGTGWAADLAELTSIQNLQLDRFARASAELRIETLVCQLLTGFVFCLLLALLLALARTACERIESGSRACAALWALRAILGFGALAAACLYWQMAQPARFEYDDASTPNSYPKLLEIAKSVEALNPNADAASLGELLASEDLRQQAAAHQLAELYFEGKQWSSQPGHMPFYAHAPADVLRFDEFRAFRQLARAWYAEGKSLAKDGDLGEAARYYTATVEVGVVFANRGLLTHVLVGKAIEGFGVSGLVRIRRELPPDAAKESIKRLLAVDRNREPHAAVVERDRIWVRNSAAWHSRLGLALESWGYPGTTHPEDTDWNFMFNQRDATLRLLIVDLSVRLYRNEHGQLPAELNDLVPRYLPSIPLDPFSGEAIRYRRHDGDFLVYCVGLDRTDNGGRIGTRIEANSKSGFDWGLEFLDDSAQ